MRTHETSVYMGFSILLIHQHLRNVQLHSRVAPFTLCQTLMVVGHIHTTSGRNVPMTTREENMSETGRPQKHAFIEQHVLCVRQQCVGWGCFQVGVRNKNIHVDLWQNQMKRQVSNCNLLYRLSDHAVSLWACSFATEPWCGITRVNFSRRSSDSISLYPSSWFIQTGLGAWSLSFLPVMRLESGSALGVTCLDRGCEKCLFLMYGSLPEYKG